MRNNNISNKVMGDKRERKDWLAQRRNFFSTTGSCWRNVCCSRQQNRNLALQCKFFNGYFIFLFFFHLSLFAEGKYFAQVPRAIWRSYHLTHAIRSCRPLIRFLPWICSTTWLTLPSRSLITWHLAAKRNNSRKFNTVREANQTLNARASFSPNVRPAKGWTFRNGHTHWQVVASAW